jgi:serine/threonine protein kinase
MNSFNQDAMSISSTDYSKTNAKPMKLTRYDTDSALKMDNLSTSGILKSTEGTYPFYSPEMCDGNHSFSGYSSDIWAAGVCLYIFASGQMPFYADSPVDLFRNISRGKVNTKGLHFSKKLKDLLSKILLKDPKKRAGLGDCLKHDFCKEARIERMHTLGENVCRSSVTRLAVNQEDRRNAFSVAKVAEAATRKVTKRLHHAKEISPRPRICHTFSTLSSSSWMDTRDQDFAKSPSTTGGKGAQMRSFMKSLSDGQKTHSSEIGSFCSSDSSTKSKCAIM